VNYGLYISAAGTLTGMHRFDVASNNLANVNTVAFKPDLAMGMQREAARIEDGLLNLDSNRLLERLGAGPLAAPTRTRFAPAAVEITNSPLDVAIREEGFFVVDSGRGEGDDALRFTRDGRFTLDEGGRLVMAGSGFPVLDDRDAPIRLETGVPANIRSDGAIVQEGRVVARLQIASPPDETALRKTGENLYRAERGGAAARRPVESRLQAGALERSGVNPISALNDVTSTSGAVRNNTRMIDLHDELMGLAVNTFGRVA